MPGATQDGFEEQPAPRADDPATREIAERAAELTTLAEKLAAPLARPGREPDAAGGRG